MCCSVHGGRFTGRVPGWAPLQARLAPESKPFIVWLSRINHDSRLRLIGAVLQHALCARRVAAESRGRFFQVIKTADGRQMQMGPTRRSTPLSPARGPRERGTWHPVSLPLKADPKTVFRWLCHRRSHRHPVPSDGGSDPKVISARPAVPRSEFPWRSFVAGATNLAEAWMPCLTFDRVLPIDGGGAFAFFSNDRFASNRSSRHADLKDRVDSCHHPDPA